jgi:type I site-specific restriction-modification system R (restriction) subunit
MTSSSSSMKHTARNTSRWPRIMRRGLPNAQYLAFTGTPLLGRERLTNAWFGDYVSEYNFQQSMDDGATVPLFYEKRVPEVLIQNDGPERGVLRRFWKTKTWTRRNRASWSASLPRNWR